MSLKYKCLLADDNLLDRDVLEMFVSKIDSLQIETVCCDGLAAAAYLLKHEIDIVFSDIDMPHLSGFELLRSLKKAPVFIFISSYASFAAESYDLDVIDFIVKPVTLARLIKATNKAIEYISFTKNVAAETAILKDKNGFLPEGKNVENHFFIKENYDYIKIAHADVIYIESMGNFSKLHTLQNKKHVVLISLKNVDQQLAQLNFIRVHKQYIIHLNQLESVSLNGFVQLTGGHSIPIGNNYKAALMEIVNKNTLLR